MFCSKCGKELDDEAVFCQGCGCATPNYQKETNEEYNLEIEEQDYAEENANIIISGLNQSSKFTIIVSIISVFIRIVYLIGEQKLWGFISPIYVIGVSVSIVGGIISTIISVFGLVKLKGIREQYEKYQKIHNLAIEEDLSGGIEAKYVYSIVFGVISLVLQPVLFI